MLTIDARAKINLSLDILGKRDDGYHEVAMIMQQLELSDVVNVREAPCGSGIELLSDIPGLPTVERNLAYKAAKLIYDKFSIKQGIAIEITKRIPIAAGLAGGSTDAAAVLTALNDIFNLGMSIDDLCHLGAQIGSDVPFCIQGGTALATGRGELVQPIAALPQCHVVLAKPQASVSTAWAYSNYCADLVKNHPRNEQIIELIKQKNLTDISDLLCNVLESVTIKRYPEIEKLKRLMINHGATVALMSGSGPTVFALTPDYERAEYIAERLKELTSTQVILTKTV